jgi:hypothetical protein
MLSRDYYVVVIVIFRNHLKNEELAGFVAASTNGVFSFGEGRLTVGVCVGDCRCRCR